MKFIFGQIVQIKHCLNKQLPNWHISWDTVIREMLIFQVVSNSSTFLISGCLISRLQKSHWTLYWVKINPVHIVTLHAVMLALLFVYNLSVYIPSDLLLCLRDYLCDILISIMRATCPIYLNYLDIITLISLFYAKYKLFSSLCISFHLLASN